MKNKKPILSILLFLVLFIAGAFMMLYLQNQLHGSTMILGVDLYPRWVGTQAVLQHESPYSQETRQKIWLAIYGSTEVPDGNFFGFYYPPAITTVLMPFVLLGIPVQIAASLWCAFLWALLSTMLVLWIINFRHHEHGLLLLPTLLISGWFFRPAFSNYFLGQYALFCILAAIASWWMFKNNHPIWAGILAALSLVKPSLTIIPIGLLFVMNWQKPKGLSAFIATSLLLYLPPTLLIGWWLPDFMKDIANYALENSVGWSILDLMTMSGLFWLLTSIVLIGLGIHIKNSLLAFASACALNAIFIPHTADYDLVAFIPLLVYLGNRWLKEENGKKVSIFFYFTLLWVPWLSLFAFMLLARDSHTVESWYRFIWLAYPPVILLSSVLTETPSLRSILHKSIRKSRTI
jgi:hypothetical protein